MAIASSLCQQAPRRVERAGVQMSLGGGQGSFGPPAGVGGQLHRTLEKRGGGSQSGPGL